MGVGEVWCAETLLRSNRLGILPSLETPDGFYAAYYAIEDIEHDGEQVRIHLRPYWVSMALMRWMQHAYHPRANDADWTGVPCADPDCTLEMVLKPEDETIGGYCYAGFSYGFRYHGGDKRIYTLVDRASWELGGQATGNTLYQLSDQPAVCTLAPGTHLNSGWTLPGITNPYIFSFLPFYTNMYGFTYQHDAAGSLVTYHATPGYIRTYLRKKSDNEELLHYHQFGFALTDDVTLPARKILYRAHVAQGRYERDNEYLALRERIVADLHAHYELRREWANPFGLFFTWDAHPRVEHFLTHGVTAMARHHIRDVFIMTMWETDMSEGLYPPGNSCCILDYQISQRFGGATYFRQLTDALHAHGIRVGMWHGQCLSSRSRYVTEKPEWFIRDMTGQIDRDHYGFHLAVFNEGHPDMQAWLLDRLRYAHETLGLDGVYRDSHFNQGTDKFSWIAGQVTGADGIGAIMDNPEALARAGDTEEPGAITPIFDASISTLRACQQMGLFYAVESRGVFGIAWAGLTLSQCYGHEFMYWNSERNFPFTEVNEMGLDPVDVYFRALANRICYGLVFSPNIGEHGSLILSENEEHSLDGYEAVLAEFARFNAVFNLVADEMHFLQVLPEACGTVWRTAPDADVRVIWTFQACDIPIADTEKVICYTGAAPARTVDTFKAAAFNVYKVDRASA